MTGTNSEQSRAERPRRPARPHVGGDSPRGVALLRCAVRTATRTVARAGRATSLPAVRAELYGEIARLAHDDAPFIVLPVEQDFWVTSGRFSGHAVNPLNPALWYWKDLVPAR